MKYRLLVIGCGNIGALYDWESDAVLTHMKAFSQHGGFEISCYDADAELLDRVCERYNAHKIKEVSVDLFRNFDVVSLCTPTFTHEAILTDLFLANVAVIVCEKPISDNLASLNRLAELYKNSKSKVLVNYIRRFQPAYLALADDLKIHQLTDPLISLAIRYQRGMNNNCSHAIDLISYLLNRKISMDAVIIGPKVYDHFEHDPTLSLLAKWDDIFLNIMGLPNVEFSHFEIDMYFTRSKVTIRDAGNTIDWFFAPIGTGFLKPLEFVSAKSSRDCIKDYMVGVSEHAYGLLRNPDKSDNFIDALEMNKSIIKLIN